MDATAAGCGGRNLEGLKRRRSGAEQSARRGQERARVGGARRGRWALFNVGPAWDGLRASSGSLCERIHVWALWIVSNWGASHHRRTS